VPPPLEDGHQPGGGGRAQGGADAAVQTTVQAIRCSASSR
jgi:hypothetical protein